MANGTTIEDQMRVVDKIIKVCQISHVLELATRKFAQSRHLSIILRPQNWPTSQEAFEILQQLF